MEYPDVLLASLESIYRLACRTCEEVEKLQPQLVVGLAHSGWMPVAVAQTLWAERHPAQPFPATLRTNIGQEKHRLYHERFGTGSPAFCCGECCWWLERLGHFLAWTSDQRPWLEQLRAQVSAATPLEPSSILVVDDLFGGIRTCYVALSLLDTLYPGAHIHMIAGTQDITEAFVSAWLETFLPDHRAALLKDAPQTTSGRFSTHWHGLLNPLVTGSQDTDPASLDWQPLGPQSEAVLALSEYLPAAHMLAAPAWALGLATQYALQRQRGEIADEQAREPEEDAHMFPMSAIELWSEARLSRLAWLQNGVTRADILAVMGRMTREAKRGPADPLSRFDWQRHRQGSAVIYYPDPARGSWITAYDQFEGDYRRVPGFACFLDGQLWAGAYPLARQDTRTAALLQDLLAQGPQVFLDLTAAHEGQARRGYASQLAQVSQELGLPAEHISFPLSFRAAPTRRRVRELLALIEATLAGGRKIYLHAGHNLEGRAPLVLCCLLISRGLPAEAALAQVETFWMRALPYLIRFPITPAQRKFILSWQSAV